VGRLVALAGAAPAADELETGGDVPPLVRAAHLQLDPELPVEVLEVGGLEEHVAELRERQATLEPGLDGVLGQHVGHGEVLADLAQEVEHRHRSQPVEVVDHQRLPRAGREVEVSLELAADPGDVGLQGRLVEQAALGRSSRRIADHAGRAADEGDRSSAVALQLEEPEDRHQVPGVQ
jgi:hypothetical protein